jgi:ORF6N domain.
MELQLIQNRIYEIRGQRVMLDFDLAEMYQVQTKRLKEQVRRNIERFPEDFMFQLSEKEFELVAFCDRFPNRLKHSSVTPFAFTQEGVAMLSGILRSSVAIQVNIQIMRAFVALRQSVLGYAELNQKLETFMIETNMQFNDIYLALSELASKKAEEESRPRRPIGYQHYDKEE